jgi:hypothetical protein
MGMRGGITEFLNEAFDRARAADGKIIGEDNDIIKTELADTDRQAWVSHMAEQYLKHEPMDDPPPEFDIIEKDIIRELAKREINKILGK